MNIVQDDGSVLVTDLLGQITGAYDTDGAYVPAGGSIMQGINIQPTLAQAVTKLFNRAADSIFGPEQQPQASVYTKPANSAGAGLSGMVGPVIFIAGGLALFHALNR